MKTNNIFLKFIAVSLVVTVVLCTSGISGIPLGLSVVAEPAVQAEQGPIGGNFCDWELEDGSKPFADNKTSWHYEDNVLTISGEGEMPNWDYVDKMTTKPVRPWQDFKDEITKIVIDNGVTSIGSCAFCNMFCHDKFGYVLDIEIGKDVKKIYYGAFHNSGFTEIVIPENVEEIGEIAFENCWHLESVAFTDKTTIAWNAFKSCRNLKYNTSLKNFSGNFSDWTVTIDGTEQKPFADNDLSWSYDPITHTLTISGEGEMPDWERVDEFTINPERPWQRFRRHITNIVIDDGVTSIGKNAFCDVVCHDYFGYVMEVEIGKDVNEIREGAFYNTSLTETVIPENVQEIGSKAFGRCWALESVMLPSNTAIIEDSDKSNSFSGNDHADISSKITRVESFGGNIENTALSWSYDPKTHTLEITGSGEIPDYNHSDHNTNDRPWQSLRRHIANIVIGNNVTSIGEYAFCDIWGHELLNQPLNITFGSGVQTIGANAFANCYITEVVIPENVKEIGIKAFGNCWALDSVLLPINTAIIENAGENNSFSGSNYGNISSKITRVGTIGGKFSEWAVTLTKDKNGNELDTPEIVKPYGNENNNYKYDKLSWSYDFATHTLTIFGEGEMPDWTITTPSEGNPDHYQHRPWYAYQDEITNIVIGSGVKHIGSYAFCNFGRDCCYERDCNKGIDLNVQISNTVESIGRNVFYASPHLKELIIPDSVTTIEREAFWHCQNLENIKLSEKLTKLEDHIFNDCKSLTSIHIPESVTAIRNSTFLGCTGLKEVEIPENVESLGNSAFEGCTALGKVTFKGTKTIPTLGDTNVFTNCPCVANRNTGLIIDSCAVLDDYRKQTGWSTLASYRDNIDKTHDITYTASGAVITENCHATGCAHKATATLETKKYHTYTGSEIKPVTNTYSDNWYGTGSTQRPENTAIVYSNNTLVGTAEATLTVTNDNGEEATSRINFEILPVLVLDIQPQDWEGPYDGKEHTITVTTNMPAGVSPITITYSTSEDGVYTDDKPSYTDVGDYTIWCRVETPDGQVVKEKATVKITPKPITDDMVEVDFTDPGNPKVTVKDTIKGEEITLDPKNDYKVTIERTPDGEDVKIKVTATGDGNYEGTVDKSITVKAEGLNGVTAEGWSGTYDGNPHYINVKLPSDLPVGTKVTYGTDPDNVDLEVNPPCTDVGDHLVYYKVTLPNGESLIGIETVKITPKPITDPTVTVNVAANSNGGNPTVTVKDGNTTLKEGKDYTVTVDPTGKVTITGTGNYDKEIEKTIPKSPGTTTPGGTTPGGTTPGSTTPGGDTSKPGGDTSKPGGDTSEPGSDTSEPGSDTSEPGGDTSEPGGDTSEPGGDTSDNSSDTSEPISGNPFDPIGGGNTSEPGGNTSEPGGNTSEPGGDTSEPGGNTSEPSGDTSDSSFDNNEPIPITGNSAAGLVWIIVLGASVMGVALKKSKSSSD